MLRTPSGCGWRVTDWVLWVDESGDFDDDTQYGAVAGVLVRAGVSGFARVRLKRALRKARPELPWPIHRTRVNHAVMHGMWALAQAKRAKTAVPQKVAEVMAAVERRAPGAFERVMDGLRRAHESEFEDVRALDRALRALPPPQQRVLKSLQQQARDGIVGGVEAAMQVGEAVPGQAAADSVWLVAAGEADNGDARHVGELEDRYLHLLGCVAGRAAALLLARGGQHRLDVRVAGRRVWDRDRGRVTRLKPMLVERALTWGLGDSGRVCHGADGSRVSASCGSVQPIDNSAPAPLVLADWCVNAFAWSSKGRVPLAVVSGALAGSVGLPTSREGLPTLAATGEPWRVLQAAREAGPECAGDAASAGRRGRPWAWEQADAWVAWTRSRPGAGGP